MMRIFTCCMLLGAFLTTGPVLGKPSAGDLVCEECVESEELEEGAVGPRELADDAVFGSTVVVRADGTPAENCTALLAALAATAGASATDRYLVKLEPGIYECTPPTNVVMNEYVDLEGSGQATTVIRGGALPVVQVAANSELRELTVEAFSEQVVRGIDVVGTAARVSDVTVLAAVGASSAFFPTGIVISGGVGGSRNEVDLDHVTVRAGVGSAVPSPIPGPERNGTALQIGGFVQVRMNDVDAQGGGIGLNVVAPSSARVEPVASRLRGDESSVRAEASNLVALIATQLHGSVGPGAGVLRCVASYDQSHIQLGPDCLLP